MKISVEEFCEKLGISQERYEEEKNRFEETHELDFRNRRILKNTNSRERIIGLAEKYVG